MHQFLFVNVKCLLTPLVSEADRFRVCEVQKLDVCKGSPPEVTFTIRMKVTHHHQQKSFSALGKILRRLPPPMALGCHKITLPERRYDDILEALAHKALSDTGGTTFRFSHLG